MTYKENKYLIYCLCSSLGVNVELPFFLFWGRCERGTADQGLLFWKRLMLEPFFPWCKQLCLLCNQYKARLVLWQKYSWAIGCVWGRIAEDTTSGHVLSEAWKQVALSHLCWVLGGTCFLVLLFDAVWCMSLIGLGFLEEKDDMERAVALEQHKRTVPGCKHMDTTAARLC